MAAFDDITPPRRPSSIVNLSQWGLVQAWLGTNSGRGLVMRSDEKGVLLVIASDPLAGLREEVVIEGEDPCKAALRAIGKMHPEAT